MITCIKEYTDLPFAHRQHTHAGHCAQIHGHNWSFVFEFGCERADDNGFVVDFGQLKWLKNLLEEMFDHTLVLNRNDPDLGRLTEALMPLKGNPFARITVVDNCSCEGLCVQVYNLVDLAVKAHTFDRVRLLSIRIKEDAKNSAYYGR